jgi:hypothetical protein
MKGTKYNCVALPYSRQNSSLVSMELSTELAIYGLSNASMLPTLKKNLVINIYWEKAITTQSSARVYLKRLARRTCSPHRRKLNLTPSLSTRVICFPCKVLNLPGISSDPIDSILQMKKEESKQFLNRDNLPPLSEKAGCKHTKASYILIQASMSPFNIIIIY